MKKLLGVVFLFGILNSFSSCNKNRVENPIPDVPFDITLNLNLPLYADLLHPMGGIVYVDNAGSKGIAVLRIGQDTFAVFDRHCPYNVTEGCRVSEDPDNIAGLKDDDCCSSLFNMINNGLPESGPATTGLKAYRYNFTGNSLRIYN
jgi:hypothetical protein